MFNAPLTARANSVALIQSLADTTTLALVRPGYHFRHGCTQWLARSEYTREPVYVGIWASVAAQVGARAHQCHARWA